MCKWADWTSDQWQLLNEWRSQFFTLSCFFTLPKWRNLWSLSYVSLSVFFLSIPFRWCWLSIKSKDCCFFEDPMSSRQSFVDQRWTLSILHAGLDEWKMKTVGDSSSQKWFFPTIEFSLRNEQTQNNESLRPTSKCSLDEGMQQRIRSTDKIVDTDPSEKTYLCTELLFGNNNRVNYNAQLDSVQFWHSAARTIRSVLLPYCHSKGPSVKTQCPILWRYDRITDLF